MPTQGAWAGSARSNRCSRLAQPLPAPGMAMSYMTAVTWVSPNETGNVRSVWMSQPSGWSQGSGSSVCLHRENTWRNRPK